MQLESRFTWSHEARSIVNTSLSYEGRTAEFQYTEITAPLKYSMLILLKLVWLLLVTRTHRVCALKR